MCTCRLPLGPHCAREGGLWGGELGQGFSCCSRPRPEIGAQESPPLDWRTAFNDPTLAGQAPGLLSGSCGLHSCWHRALIQLHGGRGSQRRHSPLGMGNAGLLGMVGGWLPTTGCVSWKDLSSRSEGQGQPARWGCRSPRAAPSRGLLSLGPWGFCTQDLRNGKRCALSPL